MDSSELIVRSQPNLVTAKEPAECRGPPAQGGYHTVVNETTASNEKEAQENGMENQAPESADENHGNGQPLIEDPRLVEFLELHKRMFQST